MKIIFPILRFIFLILLPPSYISKQLSHPNGFFGKHILVHFFIKGNEALINFMLEQHRPKQTDHILEIGFGPGQLLATLLTQSKFVAAIDISKEMVALVKSKFKDAILANHLDVRQASIQNIPYPDNQFDAVYTANTIYFWPNHQENIKEIYRVLKQRGTVVIGFRTKKQFESMNVDRTIFNPVSEAELIALLKNAGFKSIDIKHRKERVRDSYVAIAKK